MLAQEGHRDVRVLVRRPELLPTLPPHWTIVPGDLNLPNEWSHHLRGVETVMHLASSTGKARKREHYASIVDGTKALLTHAENTGASRFLYVSSVAAGFPDRRYYHYAHAKLAAEQLVRASAMDWLIVRPTMVLGPGSPVLTGLRKLAMLPVPIIFGSGKHVVQPIHVDDLSALLVAALALRPWNATITVGGTDVITNSDLLARIRTATRPGAFSFLHVPLTATRLLLGLLEPLLFPLLPFTAGQLTSFANESRAIDDPFLRALPPPRVGVERMVTEALGER